MKKILLYLLFIISASFYAQTIPSYYNDLDLNKTGDALFLELSTRIIETHSGIPYTGSPVDVWDACKEADEDPNNNSNVLLIYGFNDVDGISDTDKTRNKDLQDTGGGDAEKWNREHVFPKSLANPSLETDEPGPGTDVHNLRPADAERNTLRGNRKFTDGTGNSGIISANGGWYPGDEWKGDVARIVMYMYMRYNGDGYPISETNCFPINVGFGDINSLDPNMVELFLQWNVDDPVSDFEANRNEVLAGIQMNRNPFIDNPYLATLIWGGLNAEDKWNMGDSSDTEVPTAPSNVIASNITDESFDLNWTASTDNVEVYDYLIYLDGVYLQTSATTSVTITNLDPKTTYAVTIKARDLSSNLSTESTVFQVKTLDGPRILFEEDFEDCASLKFNAYSEASNKDWRCETQYGENGSGSMGINGYQEVVSSKDWLITNAPIDFDAETGEKISFYTDAAFGSTSLVLVYSSDYDGSGDPLNFTWVNVPNITIPTHTTGTSTEEIYEFNEIDISAINGTSVYIAFKYYSDGNPTRWTVDSFEIIADDLNPDTDGDGVLNEDDVCPNTPAGETVNDDGCSNGQLDDDNDGVQNSDDSCADTPAGEEVNSTGCSESQIDDDNDGVMNNVDLCENTPIGEQVDANGCSEAQRDDDGDGISNGDDACADTPAGEGVNASGCSESQLDDDEDGVMNNIDQCAETPTGEGVNADGCSESQLDDDNDGIMNNVDQCLATTAGAQVNELGCFTLAATNFKIETVGETCTGSSNGKIIITTVEDFNYKTTIDGVLHSFNTSLEVENLASKTYDFCISVDGETYEQCFTVNIEAGGTIAGKTSIKSNKAVVELSKGTAPFTVVVNGKELFETSASSFSVGVSHGDLVEVKTAIDCEGKITKQVNLFETVLAYPNPTKGLSNISLPISEKEVVIELYNIHSQLISSKVYPVNYGKVQLNLEEQPTGVYIAKVLLAIPVTLKVVKN